MDTSIFYPTAATVVFKVDTHVQKIYGGGVSFFCCWDKMQERANDGISRFPYISHGAKINKEGFYLRPNKFLFSLYIP